MKRIKVTVGVLMALVLAPLSGQAQQTLSLEDCRTLAIQNNKDLEQSRTKVEMAGYDKQTAFANYLPEVSATGMYMYNSRNLSLVSDDASSMLTNMGTAVQEKVGATMQGLTQAIQTNPALAAEYMSSPMWQTVLGTMSQMDLSTSLNAIGAEIDDAMHLNIHNVIVGSVSVKQPLYVGGKIVAANKIAALAEELAKTQYSQQYQQIVVTVDQDYWQVVSIANKKRLAEAYADLVHTLEKDVDAAVKAGVSTASDALSVKVKANEADMLLSKATNGLKLAKMLLCKEIGLDLSTQIVLADENLDAIPLPQMGPVKDMDAIYEDRTETRSLDLANQIYEGKAAIAKSEMLPTVALMGSYTVSNPSSFNGFENKFGGMFSAGVVVNVPIFHGGEARSKARKAEAEASLYKAQLDNAKNLINLQVTQLVEQQSEALEKLNMAESNLESAEENLRMATLGVSAGVVTANTALAAETAWLQAHTEYIEAGVELQMITTNLRKATGEYRSDIDE